MAAENTSVQTFKLEPERHIATPTWELFSQCKAELVGQGVEEEKFNELVQLLEGTSQIEYGAVRRRIKHNFQTFSLAARGKKVPRRLGKADPSEAELDEGELCFMEDLVDILEASHFRLLSAEDWATAQAEEFTFTMPVEVNWSNMDTALMARFWNARPAEEREGNADMSDRVLVYHRGITSMKARGRFIGDKIDLLVSYLVVHPFLRLYSKLPQKVKDAAPRMAVDVQEHVQDQGIGEHHGKSDRGFYTPHDTSSKSNLGHAAAKEVKRVTLKSLMPNAKAVFGRLFETLEIQEPGFKNVVVLYRRAIPDDPAPKSEKTPIRDYEPRLAKRNIHVKRFDDIPMADTEMIFPDKRVYVKPIVLIQLLVTLVLGLVAAVTTFFSMEISMNMFLSILGVVGGRAYQVYYSASIARQQVMDQITEALYEQTMDAQEGVIYFLLDQMADQHIKEATIAYFTLLSSGRSMSHDELDAACEEYLNRTYGEQVDFAIERSLPELLRDGMVQEDGQGQLRAVTIDKAHAVLKDKWSSFQQLHQTRAAVESVFQHRQTRRTATTTASSSSSTAVTEEPEQRDRIQRLSAQSKAARMQRSHSSKRGEAAPASPPGTQPGLSFRTDGSSTGYGHGTGSIAEETPFPVSEQTDAPSHTPNVSSNTRGGNVELAGRGPVGEGAAGEAAGAPAGGSSGGSTGSKVKRSIMGVLKPSKTHHDKHV